MPNWAVPEERRRRENGAPDGGSSARDRLAVFQPEVREDLRWRTLEQLRVAGRIWTLVEEIVRVPFFGTGNPEPLRYLGPDIWSRRIIQEHRLVYLVRDERIDFLQARYHY